MTPLSISGSQQTATPEGLRSLDPELVIRAFRMMHLSRRLDDREVMLKRQNKIFFQVSGATVSYFGSLVVSSPTVSVSTSTVASGACPRVPITSSCPACPISTIR